MKTHLSSIKSERDDRLRNAVANIENMFRPYFPSDGIDPKISRELEREIRILLQQDAACRASGAGRVDVTILLSDIRGFTSLVEELPPDLVVSLLNQYFASMCAIIIRHNGTVDKFMGDSIMAVFGAPEHGKHDALQALICAAEMQIAMDDLNRKFRKSGLPELYMGIGINTGKVMAGMIGSELHWEYTVIGDEVNLASRIEAYSLRGQVLISQSTHDRTKENIETGDGVEVYVKGKRVPVILYELLSVTHPVHIQLPRRELRKSPRFNVRLPFDFQSIVNKCVEGDIHQGIVLDISLHGLRVEVGMELKTFSEIKLSLSFLPVSERNVDVYAKVLSSWQGENETYQSNLEFSFIGAGVSEGIRKLIHHMLQSDRF